LPIRLYTGDERKGYQQAVKDPASCATRPWVFIVDSDYQFAAIDFWRLEPYRAVADVILDVKSPRRDPFYRIWLSRGYNFLLRLFFGVPFVDMDTGFRLVRREVLAELAPAVRHMSFFTAGFVIRAHRVGYRIVELPVHRDARKIGSASIFFVSKLLFICVQQFIGILKMKREFRAGRP
jgi:hypothetical protein